MRHSVRGDIGAKKARLMKLADVQNEEDAAAYVNNLKMRSIKDLKKYLTDLTLIVAHLLREQRNGP
jgi:hypothetical protein